MRLKEYPEVMVDVIPKLYESHCKVFITHLYGMEEKLERLTKKFCKMYTTQPLADQLFKYLQFRGANVSRQDFVILKESQPFQLRLSDGKRLEAMLCAGNELGNSLMLLIRRIQGRRLLFYYSAVQQAELWRLMGNLTYQQWIAEGAEELWLNLQSVDQPFEPIDFDELAQSVSDHATFLGGVCGLKLPLLGYEYLISRLARTPALNGHIHLLPAFKENYTCLTADLSDLEQPNFVVTLKVAAFGADRCDKLFPLKKLQWTPVPTRMNLIQLCSLLRPVRIYGIVDFHASGVVPQVPQYLKRFRLRNSPRPRGSGGVPETQLPHTSPDKDPGQTLSQTEVLTPRQEEPTTRRDPGRFVKKTRIQFVDYDDDED